MNKKIMNIFTASFILVFTFLHFNTKAQSVLGNGGNTTTSNITQTNITPIGNKFFVQAGLAFSSMNFAKTKNNVTDNSDASSTNLNFGVFYQTKIGNDISLEPGINFAFRGNWSQDGKTIENSTILFLEIPANFVYHINDLKLIAGPTLSIPISKGDSWGSLDFNSPIGLNVGLGYNFNKIRVQGIYNFGLSSLYSNDSDIITQTFKISSFNISCAYNF